MSYLDNLTSKEQQYLAALHLGLQAGTREHSKVKGAFFASAEELQKKFGDSYKTKCEKLFNVVDDSYHYNDKKSKSYTKAFQFKKEIIAELYNVTLQQSTKPRSGVENENYFTEKVQIEKLDYLVSKGVMAFKNIEHYIAATMYCQVYNREDGCNYVQYCRKSEKNLGRRFAQSPSLQSLPKIIREVLCEGTHAEIDMTNAHPTIFLALANAANIKAENIERLVNNRAEVYNEVASFYGCDLKAAKTFMLQTSYLCQLTYEVASQKAFTQWCDENSTSSSPAWEELVMAPVAIPFAKDYQKEIMQIIESWSESTIFHFANGIKYKSRKASIMIQYIEDCLLQKMIDVLINHSIKIDALSFDGLCIRDPQNLTSEIINKMETAMNNWFRKIFKTNLDMKLSIKNYGA